MQNWVAVVDIDWVASTQLIYNNIYWEFEGLRFVDADGCKIGIGYFQNKIPCINPLVQKPRIEMDQVLIAGVFTCDLDFLSKILGHQGASLPSGYVCSAWQCKSNWLAYLRTKELAQGSPNNHSSQSCKCMNCTKSNFCPYQIMSRRKIRGPASHSRSPKASLV